MKFILFAAFGSILSANAALLPTAKLNPEAVRKFDDAVAAFESGDSQRFIKTGALWIDGQGESRKKSLEAGTPVTEMRSVVNVPGGQIHHLFGTIRIAEVTMEQVLATMQSYSKYPEFFKGDVAKASSKDMGDSRPESRHLQVSMLMTQSTAWLDVAFDTSYDTRFDRVDPHRVNMNSHSLHLREYKDAHHLDEGTLPEGEDHGFLWRTYTSWHLREREGGVDMELNNMSLSRPVPFGFNWWANRTAKSAVEKMITHTAEAIRRIRSNP